MYTFYLFTHFMKSKNVFSVGFFLKILVFFMVSIQERFLIKRVWYSNFLTPMLHCYLLKGICRRKTFIMHTSCTNAIERKVSTLLFQKGFYHIFSSKVPELQKERHCQLLPRKRVKRSSVFPEERFDDMVRCEVSIMSNV